MAKKSNELNENRNEMYVVSSSYHLPFPSRCAVVIPYREKISEIHSKENIFFKS